MIIVINFRGRGMLITKAGISVLPYCILSTIVRFSDAMVTPTLTFSPSGMILVY